MQLIKLDIYLDNRTIILKHGEEVLAEDGFQWTDSVVSTRMDLDNFERYVESSDSSSINFVRSYGQKLYHHLFTEKIRQAWDAKKSMGTRNQVYHLRLRIDSNTDHLWQQLPWEFMHDGQEWLLQKKNLSFSRFAPNASDQPFEKLNEPLRMLIMVCAPQDLPEQNILNPRLEEDLIQRATLEAYRSGELEVSFTIDGQLNTLEEELQEFKPHLLHISAHGSFNGGRGYLLMESPEGNSEMVSHEKIIQTLSKPEDLRLTVFSACQTAQVSSSDGMGDLGQRLLADDGGGLGAVLAMKYSITETSANAFLSQFYEEIVVGSTIDRAASQARRSIPREQEIGTPVLYLADPEALQINREKFREHRTGFIQRLEALPDTDGFVGRSRELHQLQSKLQFKGDVYHAAVVFGMGGIGKTALVKRMAERSYGIFKGAIALRMTPGTNIQSILDEFREFFSNNQFEWHSEAVDQARRLMNQPPDQVPLEKREESLEKALADIPVLVIFDNCEDILPESFYLSQHRQEADNNLGADTGLLEFLAKLILMGKRCSRFIFTSRKAFSLQELTMDKVLKERLENEIRVLYQPVNEFGSRESFYLMDALPELSNLPYHNVNTTDGSVPILRSDIFEVIGGHPYYLHLFARQVKKTGSIMEAYKGLADIEKEIRQYTMLNNAIKSLPERAGQLFERASVMEHPTPEEGWAYLMGNEADCMPPVKEDLQSLVADGLVMAFSDETYQPYKLAAEGIQISFTEKKKNQLRFADFWWIHRKETQLMDDAMRAWHYYLVCEENEKAFHILSEIYPILYRWSQWNLCRTMLMQIQEKIPDKERQGINFHNLGMIEQAQGRYDTALDYYKQSQAIKEELRDRSGIASTLHQMGMIEQDQGRYDTALDYYKQSLAIKEELGNRSGIAKTLHQMGVIEQDQGRYDTALDYYKQSLAIKEELGNRSGIAYTLHQMGTIEQAQGRYDTALDYYQQSLAIKKELGDRSGIAVTLHQMGKIEQEQSRYDTALDYYKQSLTISEELGDRSGIAGTLHNLGIIEQAQGRYDTALDYYKQSLAISEELGNRSGIAISLGQLGLLAINQKDWTQAVSLTAQSFVIFLELEFSYARNCFRILSSLFASVPPEEFRQTLSDAVGKENAEEIIRMIIDTQ